MTLFEAGVLGLIQGFTEFLPVSSSGHLVIAQQWFGLQADVLTFDVLLHLATLLAIIAFFGRSLFKLHFKDWVLIGVGTIPAVIIGVFFKDAIEALFANDKFVGVELILTGLINFFIDWRIKHMPAVKPEVNNGQLKMTPWQSFTIGVAQAIAIIPGISRSGSTVAGSVLFGLDRETAFRYSFLLAIPALAGAGILEGKDLIGQPLTLPLPAILVGCTLAAVSGFASLYVFKYVMEKAHLSWFGWYCVVVGVLYTLTLIW